MVDWSDLRLFLAMSKEGSLSAAARALKVSQPTLSRRLTALEDNLGAELFIRSVDGLLLTPTGEQLVEYAERMENDATTIERIASSDDQTLKGRVTITAPEPIGAEWLAKNLLNFHESYPEVAIDLQISNKTADLLRREADIAIRMYRPTEPDLIAKKVATISYGLYATQSYIDKRGRPENSMDMTGHHMVFPSRSIMEYIKPNLNKQVIKLGKPVFSSNSMVAMATATLAGYGIGVHSCLAASQHPELIKLCPETLLSMEVWLVTHKDIRRNARIRVAYDYIADLFKNRIGAVAAT